MAALCSGMPYVSTQTIRRHTHKREQEERKQIQETCSINVFVITERRSIQIKKNTVTEA